MRIMVATNRNGNAEHMMVDATQVACSERYLSIADRVCAAACACACGRAVCDTDRHWTQDTLN